MTKEDIYEALCDIAEDMLTTPEELLSFLAAQSEQIGQKQREKGIMYFSIGKEEAIFSRP